MFKVNSCSDVFIVYFEHVSHLEQVNAGWGNDRAANHYNTLQVGFEPVQNLKQSPRGVLKKGVLKDFAEITGKHLCQSLFFNKVAD